MFILIIGCNGFIGNHAYNFFSKHGENRVLGCDIFNQYDKANFHLISNFEDAIVELFRSNKFDVCINASGMANVALSEKDPLTDYKANVSNTIKILEAIRQHNPVCKFIHLSSAAVYGNPVNLPVSETDTINPISIYGFHKWQSEILCKEYAQVYKIKTISLRLFSVYGEGLKKQLFWDLTQKFCNSRDVVQLHGKPEDSRDFIYIPELLNVFELIIKKSTFDGDAINVANGIETTIESVVKTYTEIVGCKKEFQYSNHNLPGYPSRWKADISKLKELGYTSNPSMKEGLTNYYTWYRDLN